MSDEPEIAKKPTTKTEYRRAHVQHYTPQRAHILVVDDSSAYIDALKQRIGLVNLPLEMEEAKPMTKKEYAELAVERRDEAYGRRPILTTKEDWYIDDKLEKKALTEQNIARRKARHSDSNPFRYCEFEFMNTNNPNAVLARIQAGEPKIDAVVTGLSTYRGGKPEFYGLDIVNTLAKNNFDGVMAVTASQSSDSHTLKEEARKAGAIGLFDKGDDTLFKQVREALANRGQTQER